MAGWRRHPASDGSGASAAAGEAKTGVKAPQTTLLGFRTSDMPRGNLTNKALAVLEPRAPGAVSRKSTASTGAETQRHIGA